MDISEKLINLIEYYGSIISYEYVHDKNYLYIFIFILIDDHLPTYNGTSQ